MRLPSSLKIDSPSWPLLQAHVSYWGISTANGNVFGTTIVCDPLVNEPSYQGLSVKVLDGAAAGQVRSIATHPAGTNTLTVADPFTDNAGAVVQIVASTRFVILSISGGGAGAPPLAPSIGLWMFGICDPGMVASTFTLLLTNLAGFPDDIFNNEFWIQVIHNVNAPGTAPERQIRRVTDYVGATGTFTTDAFVGNVEANDLVCVFHESVMGIEILGFGTTTSGIALDFVIDANRPALYLWENNDYFKGCLFMTTEGNCRFQPRPISGYTAATGRFDVDEPFSQVPQSGMDYVIIAAAYPYQRLSDIFNIVNAILVLTETGGIVTTTGAEQNIYINNAPAGVYKPIKVLVDFTLQQAADTVVLRTYYRIAAAPAALILKDEVTFAGVQNPPLINIDLEPNRYGIWVSIQRTAGVARDYPWEVFYEA